jgi:hypothetical protein
MIDLMRHIDYMYDPVWTLDGKTKYFVYLKDEIWRIQEDGDDILKTKTPELVLDFLEEIGVNLEPFHTGLIYHVATEATVHMMSLKKCQELIGVEACEKSYEAWEDFGKSLGKEIRRFTSGLKVVE